MRQLPPYLDARFELLFKRQMLEGAKLVFSTPF